MEQAPPPHGDAHRGEQPGVRCHFVWLGRALPYFARLAVESALVAMPDAEVHLHYIGRAARGEHADRLAAYPRVTVSAAPLADCFADCPGGARPYLDVLAKVPNGSPAAISNLVRLAVLRRHGGVYLDTDVLVVRGLHDPDRHGAYLGRELVWAGNRNRVEGTLGPAATLRAAPWALTWAARRTDSRCLAGRANLAARLPDRDSRLQVNNAVIGAPAGAALLDAALARARTVDPTKRFALGPSLLDDVAAGEPELVRLVPPSRFYPVPPGQSYLVFEDVRLQLPADTQVVHYVASNHRSLLAALQPTDRRFDAGQALFWRLGRAVQQAVAAGRASQPVPPGPSALFHPPALFRRAG